MFAILSQSPELAKYSPELVRTYILVNLAEIALFFALKQWTMENEYDFRLQNLIHFSFPFAAAVVPAIFIVLASYAECNRMLVVAYFTLAMGFMGTFYPGMKVNPLDLSPNYAGSLMAVTNGIGALAGIFAPNFVGVMAPNVSCGK